MASVYKPNEKGKLTPKRGAKWRMRFKDEHGKWRNLSSGTTCKQTALAEAHRRETESVKRRSGLLDAGRERFAEEGRKPVGDHVSNYRDKLTNAGRSKKHISDEIAVIERFLSNQQLLCLAQDNVQSYLSTLVASKKSNRTRQKHLTALRSFFGWLVDQQKIASNPTKGIEKPSPNKDRRHQRRMLTREEWSWLASGTLHADHRWSMSGEARRLLYWTAIETGYRSNELRQLKTSSLRKLGDKYVVCIDADRTKNGKSAKQYLSADLAAELLGYAQNKKPADVLFDMPSASNVVRMLRDDLSESRSAWLEEVENDKGELQLRSESDFLTYSDHEGKKLDFHALRHTCGAWLIIAGVDVKTVQTVMRHSTPTLTLNTYGHLMEGAESRAIEAANVAPVQTQTKLAAGKGKLGAADCHSDVETVEPTNAKSPQNSEGFAKGCTSFPFSALAPPPGLEPGTHGLTVHCSTN